MSSSRRLPGLDVPKVQMQTHYIREQYVFADPPDPDHGDPVTNLDREYWVPVQINTSREYQEAWAVVLELYHRDVESTHRVWIETRIW